MTKTTDTASGTDTRLSYKSMPAVTKQITIEASI